MKPVLIGQAPGPNTDPELPLFPLPKTSGGGRLFSLTGLSQSDYIRLTHRLNLLNYFPGSNKQGDKFPMREARAAAEAVRWFLADRVVIFAGRNVAEAFGYGSEYEFLTWYETERRRFHGAFRFAIVPHPSGRNHWYNREENRVRSAVFWEGFRTMVLNQKTTVAESC